jgi:hypothetical protein
VNRRFVDVIALLLAMLFFVEGVYGVAFWISGHPFWTASGPIIVQGFGMVATLLWARSVLRS